MISVQQRVPEAVVIPPQGAGLPGSTKFDQVSKRAKHDEYVDESSSSSGCSPTATTSMDMVNTKDVSVHTESATVSQIIN